MPLLHTKRPESTKERIIKAFESQKASTQEWGLYNGRDDYLIAGFDTFKLLKNQIESSPDQLTFNLLDIGTGDGEAIRVLSQKINEDKTIPKNLTFNLIGVRVESKLYTEHQEREEIGQCVIFDYSGFNAEFLIQELNARHHLDQKFDIVMSRWCMRHLVDPMGTFDQAYEITREDTGLLLMDGFWFQIDGQAPVTDSPGQYSIQMSSLELLTKNAGAKLLHHPYNESRSFDQFIIQKGNLPLELPFEYTEKFVQNIWIQAGRHASMLVFKETYHNDHKIVHTREIKDYDKQLIGDEDLFQELQNCLFNDQRYHRDPLEYSGHFELAIPLLDNQNTTDAWLFT